MLLVYVYETTQNRTGLCDILIECEFEKMTLDEESGMQHAVSSGELLSGTLITHKVHCNTGTSWPANYQVKRPGYQGKGDSDVLCSIIIL